MDDDPQASTPRQRNNRRVAQACHRCRDKKIRCDGKVPTCTPCARLVVPCDYAQAQRRRGPGKSKTYIQDLESRLANMENAFRGLSQPNPLTQNMTSLESPHASTASIPNDFSVQTDTGNLIQNPSSVSDAGSDPSPLASGPERVPSSSRHALITAPTSILQGLGGSYLQGVIQRYNDMRQKSRYDKFQQEIFAPVFSSEPIQRYIEGTFDAISAPYPLLEWSSFDSQLSDRSLFNDPAWRARVNAIMAMTSCYKAASSGFCELQGISWAYFKTAFSIFPELMVYGKGLDAIEAILTMAKFVRESPDVRTLSLLISTASRLYQVMYLHERISPTTESKEFRQRKRVYWVTYALEQELSLKHGLPQALDSDMPLFELPGHNPTDTIMTQVFFKRVGLASIDSLILKKLYSALPAPEGMQTILETMRELESSLEEWRLQPGAVVQPRPDKSSLKDLDTDMTIHIVGLYLSYYNSIQMISWSLRRFHNSDGPDLRHISLLAANRCAETAQATLSLIEYISSLPFPTIWLFSYYFISSHIILLTLILESPAGIEATAQISAMESFVKCLGKIRESEGFELKQIIAGCTQMVSTARIAIEGTTTRSPGQQFHAMNIQAQAIRNIMNRVTYPIHLTQNFMSNLKNKDYDVAVALARELSIPWTLEQRYGPFVPESLMPETYAFSFEAARDSSMYVGG